MNILQYDLDTIDIEELANLYNYLKPKFNGELIAIPKNLEILRDCTIEQLSYVRDCINKAIEELESANEG